MGRIQMRRGLRRDFDPAKMFPGEWAVTVDPETENQIVYMCFQAGVVKRMGTYEDFKEQVREATDDIREEYEQTFNEIKVYMEGLKSDTEGYKNVASQKATQAFQSAANSANSADASDNYSKLSKSYAVGTDGQVRPNDAEDNAKTYYEKTKQIAQKANGLVPMGTIPFAELPTSDILDGAMYNISDDFLSDDRFEDGGNKFYGAGSNVYWVATDGKWDVTASSAVVGVKGAKESTYRQGLVELTPEGIGAATMEDLEGVNADFIGTQKELDDLINSGEAKEGMTVFLRGEGGSGGGGGTTGDISNSKVTFEEAETRENVESGEPEKTLWGKAKKIFSDLETNLFSRLKKPVHTEVIN